MQKTQFEWNWQWNKNYDDNEWLFTEWIHPNKLIDFKDKLVLDCGCGGGGQLNLVAPHCKNVVGIDLNTINDAKKNTMHNKNVEVLEGDIADMQLNREFDIVYSVGVLHHTDDPTKSFNNIKKFVKKGGTMIIWVYSYEGNFLTRTILESLKKHFFLKMNKDKLWLTSNIITFFIYILVYSLYSLPLSSLPFYHYFQNWKELTFRRNNLNIFDKLNAPTTFFIKKNTVKEWFNRNEFSDIHISSYKGVSWRASGRKL